MSLYADYIKEREGKHIIEDEDGFATYLFGDGYVYIVDIYVTKESRHKGVGQAYAEKIAEIAKEKGFNKLLGTVDPLTNGSTYNVYAFIKYGFKISSCDGTLIYLTKEI